MGDTILIETTADEVVSIVTQGPQGPSGAEAATLTTQGDTLYRGLTTNQRLPIGAPGQVLKVNSGATAPEWANESGAVTEVNGQTGAVTLTAADVGAAGAWTREVITLLGNTTLSSARAKQWRINANEPYELTLPTSGVIAGDEVELEAGTLSTTLTIKNNGTSITTLLVNERKLFRNYTGTADGWDYDAAIIPSHVHLAGDIVSGTFNIARIPTGTGSTQVALGNHTHGNLTNDGKVGSTAGLPLKTGTAGVVEAGAFGVGAGEFAEGNHTHADLHTRSHAITSTSDHTAGNHKVFYSNGSGEIVELALGNSGEVLTSNGATSPPSFAAASGGISAVGASAADILSVSGSDLVADDPNADRLVFWDDSAGALKYLTAGSGLTITDTTITASSFDAASPPAIGNTTPNTGAFTSLSTAPAADTSAFTTTGYSLTGSSDQSLIDLAGTWNTTGTPSAIKLNITDTASNASSLLMQLQTGGTNRFTVRRDGELFVPAATNTDGGIESGGNFRIGVSNGGTNWLFFNENFYTINKAMNIGGIGGGTVARISMNNTGSVQFNGSWLISDASTALAQRDGTNAQEKRLYGTYSSSTNYQRMTIKSVKQTLSALSGASATTTGTFIPDGAVVVGVTTRVATALTGASGYEVGDGTDADRWGDITGTAIGTTSDNRDWTAGTIECFTAGGEITLTAKTSNFTAGAIEICVFYLAGEAD